MHSSRMGTSPKSRAWIAIFAVSAFIATTAAAAQALPPNFWGVVPQATPTAEQLQRLKRGGVQSVRIGVSWGALQPSKGVSLNWSGLDAEIEAATRAGLDVLPFVYGAPSWAVPATWVPGSGHSVKAPKNLPAGGSAGSAWSSFLKQAVARYGPDGSFWADNPTLPKRPIQTWQIWNEENFKYFVARPNPAEYGRLVKLSYTAITGADPEAEVILGGMFAKPKGGQLKAPQSYFATDFLEQMYRKTPGVKRDFSGVALHPYSVRYQQLAPDIEELRTVLTRNHDAGKGLWITELGWSSEYASRGDEFAKGPSGQAAQLRGAFSMLSANQAKWRIQRVYWFSVDDLAGACNFCGGSGLFGAGFKPKPAWKAYVKFAGGTAG
jgi:polysaccharide biosynthesis protein PslG